MKTTQNPKETAVISAIFIVFVLICGALADDMIVGFLAAVVLSPLIAIGVGVAQPLVFGLGMAFFGALEIIKALFRSFESRLKS